MVPKYVLLSKSKGRGKSGGARLITCIKVIANTVYLFAIYNKFDFENISQDELK